MLLTHLILVSLIGISISLMIIEKRHFYPIICFYLKFKKFLYKNFGYKVSSVLNCTVCFAFWTALFVELCLLYWTGLFLWPFSGFVSSAILFVYNEI